MSLQKQKRQSLIVAFIITIVRYYDYAIFGLSASILSKHFMPQGNDSYQLSIFFALFAISTIAKPIGSVIFGRIGDLAGRVVSVKLSTAFAFFSTSLIAFLPEYSTIGVWSVLCLGLVRMLFLASLAAETDAIKIYVAELVDKKRRHLAIGVVSFCSQIGVLFASLAFNLSVHYSQIDWIWRLNFIIGGVLGLVVILLRSKLNESQFFTKSKEDYSIEVNDHVIRIILKNKTKFFLATIISGMFGGGYQFLVIFLNTFLGNISGTINKIEGANNNIWLISIYAISSLFAGFISDKTAPLKQVIFALCMSILCSISMAFVTGYNFTSHAILVFLVPLYWVPSNILIQSIFFTKIRMRMYSLSHSLGSMLLSTTTPFFCMLIWDLSGVVSLVLAYFIFQLVVLIFALIYLIKKDYINSFEIDLKTS